MSFLNKLVDGLTHHNQGQGQNQQQGGYGGQQQQNYGGGQYSGQQQQGPPQPPHPWRAEWDGQSQRWVYINQENGQRSHEFPQSQYGGGYGQQYGGQQSQPQYNQGPPQGQYGNQSSGYGAPAGAPPAKKQGMGYGGMALAAGAGLAGGALLMHEGEKVGMFCTLFCYLQFNSSERTNADMVLDRKWDEDKDRFENRVDYDKDRFENRVDYDENRVEDFPDDAARWGMFLHLYSHLYLQFHHSLHSRCLLSLGVSRRAAPLDPRFPRLGKPFIY